MRHGCFYPGRRGTTTTDTYTFDGGTEGFTYADDAFRGTANPAYAAGFNYTYGGNPNGMLHVMLGGVDNADVSDMSGAWEKTITLAEYARTNRSRSAEARVRRR